MSRAPPMPEKLQTNNVGKKKRPIEVSDGQIRTNFTHLFSLPCFVLSLYYPIFLYIVLYTLNYFIIRLFWFVVWMWIACSIILPVQSFKFSSQTALSPQWLDDLSCLSCLNCKTVSLCVSFHILRASYSVLLSWI